LKNHTKDNPNKYKEMRILANDGIAADGKSLLTESGFEVITDKINQDDLAGRIKEFDILIVRSATKVNRAILEAGQGTLKLVVRAGVGVDNIDLASAKEFGIDVSNTPLSSSLSVAELVFAHLFSLVRFIGQSNINMTDLDVPKFNELKKKYSEGIELRGKTLGLIGFGRIGQETAKIGISLGMKVVYHDPFVENIKLRFEHLPFNPTPSIELNSSAINEVFKEADFITLHVPFNKGMTPTINRESLQVVKKGVGIVNCARGGVVDELALLDAISSGQVAYAALDVFEYEPEVRKELQNNPKISLTPHIGASTKEAQDRISLEVAMVIKNKFSK